MLATRVYSNPAIRKVWHVLPFGLRRGIELLATETIARRATSFRSPQPGPFTVVGLFRSVSGIGQAARLLLNGLQTEGFETRYWDLTRHFHRIGNITGDLGQEARSGEGGPLLIHLNPPELPRALSLLGSDYLRGKRLIGYWSWELRTLPASWKRSFSYLDEVWVPTRFVADAVTKENCTIPVRIVPPPMLSPCRSSLQRADFGLPDDAVFCLTMFDMRSSTTRKNPVAAIRSFRLAFADDPRFVLVVKINQGAGTDDLIGILRREARGAGNIRFMSQELQTEEVLALIQCSDIVLSLHRSEGFGLVLAEAMRLGKPVIATGWSGNIDFMNASNAALINYQLVPVRDGQNIYTQKEEFWAEPDIEHAAGWLRRLAADKQFRNELGGEAARDAAQYFAANLANLSGIGREVLGRCADSTGL